MRWIMTKMKWIMLVSGLLTCSMIMAAIDPQSALQSTFGETMSGPLVEVVVRNWGALITLIGILLLYGAWNVAQRPLILLIAGSSKLVFIGLVLAQGSRYLSQQAGIAIAIDSVMVILFGIYLLGVRQNKIVN
ncbi:hypothetical protein Hgul01_00950 [Herpetosiphon gulosus]|uniref:DUF2127 domain-containing protein n=2 Tax=Herpetosiphon gulosus TaxID=1973496 RepID=A0ABP9WXB7_9CHLR